MKYFIAAIILFCLIFFSGMVVYFATNHNGVTVITNIDRGNCCCGSRVSLGDYDER